MKSTIQNPMNINGTVNAAQNGSKVRRPHILAARAARRARRANH